MRVRWAVLIAWCALCSAPARADEPSAAQVQAQALFEHGLQLSTQERWADARAAFLDSARLIPRASTYFNLAVSSLELGLGRATLEALDRFDTLADPDKHADYSQRATKLRAEARALVGTLELSIAPDSAQLEIDGNVEPATGATRIVLLDPGLHVVRASAAQYEARSIEITIRARETAHQRIELTAPPAAAPAAAPAKIDLSVTRVPVAAAPAPLRQQSDHSAQRRATSLWSKPLLWIAVGAVVAGVTAVVVLAARDRDTKPYGGSTQITLDPLTRFGSSPPRGLPWRGAR